MKINSPLLFGFSAYSGTGKTTLLEKLIPLFRNQGVRVAVIKHAHHNFELDYPGKDSYRLRKAGAIETLIASKYRWALIHEQEDIADEPHLNELIQQLNTSDLDLILVEGFKHEPIPRIELHRTALKKDFLYPNDQHIVAIATDSITRDFGNLAVLDINNPPQIFHFILRQLKHDTK